MMRFLQNLGKSMMLPVAVLPIAALLVGVSYWIEMATGTDNFAVIFIKGAGGAILDNMPLLFAIGVSIGMAKQSDGTSALAGLVSWLMITKLLNPVSVGVLQGVDELAVNPAFNKIENAFIGIICGLIGAACYNRFKDTKLPDALAFFSGKRSVAIVTGLASLIVGLILYFVWPICYTGLVNFGEFISGLGAVGAGLYGFFNRLLIPFGLHHAHNSVFWFDVAGINDLTNFLNGTGTYGVTGQYLTGFFPIMMFGLPAACLAMYHTAKTRNKKIAAGLMLSAAVTAFVVGVTEPIEFSFMFLAPALYGVHAVLTGLSLFICTILPVRAGFGFSAGLMDLVLNWNSPMAENPWMVIPIGIVYFGIYYAIFRFVITKFNLKTPGREDDTAISDDIKNISNDFAQLARDVLAGLGGKANITELDNCATRLRIQVKDTALIDEGAIKRGGARGVMKMGATGVQVIIGTNVQFVADGMKDIMAGNIPEDSSPDTPSNATTSSASPSGAKKPAQDVSSSIEGDVIDLKDVPDATFAEGIMGPGVAVKPSKGEVKAPFDGTVEQMFDTGHAVVVSNADGLQILTHFGIDTVNLKGDGFTQLVKTGDTIKAGQALIEVDLAKISSSGYNTVTPIIALNADDFESVTIAGKQIK
ncbi:MAG: N-acetylglucosamine-specific PTS transporter subunit IIBC [Candidatus Ancillula sp.]|jgi:PTS system N-acetylglucosamine-specific IIC component|nr:N-acetylglucosamine-specific PTS transporter subunit IIBC [Candidatus Ancillula sp.]